MVVMRPRRSQSSLSGAIADRRRDEEQQRRQRVVTPKPAAAAPAGGGISGVTRCDAIDFQIDSVPGFSTLSGTDWEFSSLYDASGPTVTADAGDPFKVVVAAAGWYMATLNFNVSWDAVPSSLSANITFTGDDVDYPTDFDPIYAEKVGASAQVRQSLPSPWVLLPAGGWFRASLGWAGAASVSFFHHLTIDVTKG